MRAPTHFVIALAVLATPGCATLVKGTTQIVTVSTEPAGANCILSREGRQVAVINPTPGTVTVDKARGTISVACRKVGFQDSVGAMASSFQSMTFGNIIFGGLIGVAVDAASGAMNEYPPLITITLVPEEFASVADRDVFFDNMRATFLTEADEVKQRIRTQCKENCDQQLKAVDDGVAPRLAEIESRRFSASVRGR
jgi:cobalamin biosynthesis protein CbiD